MNPLFLSLTGSLSALWPTSTYSAVLVAVLCVSLLALFFFSGDGRETESKPTAFKSAPAEDDVEDDDEDYDSRDPFPSKVFRHEWLEKSPVDEPHPYKWVAPERLGDLVKDAEWNSEEVIPFLNQFDKHAKEQPGQVALTWIGLNGEVQREMTYADLQAQSAAMAVALRTQWGAKPGDRVMIVYPPGFDFLVAFLGCIRAHIVAVPVYPPNPLKLSIDVPKLTKLVEDCGASLVLSSREYYYGVVVTTGLVQRLKWPGKRWLTTDSFRSIRGKPSGEWVANLLSDTYRKLGLNEDQVGDDRLLFLQYTSGSTSDPKGVMIGNYCVAHNNCFVRRSLRMTRQARFFSWLPQYHDMGLICAYLTTLSAGAQGFFTSPLHFLQRPALWLQAMSKHRCTHTATPNFALDLTMRKFVPERDAPDGLDLSALECVVNGAEPIQVASMERWIAVLKPYGFAPCALSPAYGLAEHTVGATAWGSQAISIPAPDGNRNSRPRVLHSSGNLDALVDGRGFWRLVDPYTLAEVPEGVEGEIWIHSKSVAQGYWNKPKLTQKIFHARVRKTPPGRPKLEGVDFLRTGDLAVNMGNQFFITGRLKDLIIINGRNFYPQDIEKSVEAAVPHAVRLGCLAAFSLTGAHWTGTHTESLGIVMEVKEVPKGDRAEAFYAEVTVAVRSAVNTNHQINPLVVAIIPPRSIPKTTSGKIRRNETRSALQAGRLSILNSAMCGAIPGATTATTFPTAGSGLASSPSAETGAAPATVPLEDLPADAPLEAVVRAILQVPDSVAIAGSTTLVSLGMTSMHAIEVAEAIQNRAGKMVPLEEVLLFSMADVRKLKVDLAAAAAVQEEMRRLAAVPDLRLGPSQAEDRASAAAAAAATAGDAAAHGVGDVPAAPSSNLSDGTSSEEELDAHHSGSSSSSSSSISGNLEDEAEREGGTEADVPAGLGAPRASILAIGTAVPPQVIPQWQFSREYLKRFNCSDPLLQDKLNRICAVSDIETRHSALTEADLTKYPELSQAGASSIALRNRLFASEGVKYASQAAERALGEWGGSRGSITHLLVASMSAMHMPGLDLQLAKALHLPRSVHRLNLQMVGCHAGVMLMRVASDLCQANTKTGARILVVCCELSSLNVQAADSNALGNLVASAIFGDGAAAMVIGSGPMPPLAAPDAAAPQLNHPPVSDLQERPLFDLYRTANLYLPDTEAYITTEITQSGLQTVLERDLPRIVPAPVKGVAEQMLALVKVPAVDAFWAVHPGGRAILDAVERVCQLNPENTAASRDVLRNYGNMSSASVVFVLDKLRTSWKENEGKSPWGLTVGFGPGVSLEMIMMRIR